MSKGVSLQARIYSCIFLDASGIRRMLRIGIPEAGKGSEK